jgi:uncharacterized membrane protein YhaH (DUF805 family)
MKLLANVRNGLTNFMSFRGRASRSEFWLLEALLTVVLVLIIVISNFVYARFPAHKTLFAIVFWLMYGTVVLSSWAGAARRLHDRNRWAWHLLWIFLPFAGGIVLLIWWCAKGTSGANRYGEDPLASSGMR